jgi:hypothetical protein
MRAQRTVIQPLSPEKSLYMRQAASQALDILQQFSGGPVAFGPTALQLLDEWVDRMQRQGPLSRQSHAFVLAFLGHTFLQTHGGFWATEVCGERRSLGVICPLADSQDEVRFIDIVDATRRRLEHGIQSSLALFYMTTSVELKRRM